MKQIDIIKTYSQKHCLIVEDNADVRTGLKRILVDFGATDVDIVGHADEAIEISQKKDYDLVLADYNLGKGKNGQQLLEELRFQRLLKNSAIFILITAESSVQHVILALDHQPDDYLGKPVNKDTLRPRLDAALLKSEALSEVKNALDLRRPQSAIQACKKLISSDNRYKNDAKRILGKLLCDAGLFTEALELYLTYSESQRPLWAELGLASAYIGANQLDPAQILLNQVISNNQYCAEAYDVLAELYQQKHKFGLAQQALSTAVGLSPTSPTRQRELGKVCTEADDHMAAAHAFRAALKHSKNSSQENVEDNFNLVKALLAMMKKDDKKAKGLADEALETLKHVDKKHSKHPLVQIRKRMLKADIYNALEKTNIAEQEDRAAIEIYETLRLSVVGNSDPELCIDTATALMARGKYDEGEKLLQELAKHNNDKKMAIQIDKLLREPLTKEGIAYAATLNKRGIEFHKNNQFEKAHEAFSQVIGEIPNHIGLNLNLIQTLISKSKEAALSDNELSTIQGSLQRIGQIHSESPYRKRYDYLVKHYEKLVTNGEARSA